MRPLSVNARDVAVRRGDVEMLDEVVVLGHHTGATLAAAVLGAVERERRPLRVAGASDRDHHVLVGDHVFNRDVMGLRDDLGAAAITVALAKFDQLALDLGHDQRVGGQERAQSLDEDHELAILREDLLALAETGQLLEAQIQDRLGFCGSLSSNPLLKRSRASTGV